MASHAVLPVAGWAAWDGDAAPDVSFVEPLLRRRLSHLDRIALHVLHACARQDEKASLVFASRHGELARSAELLAQLARDEVPSPMAFSLSVLNAAVGLYGIARADRSPSTAVSAGSATFPMALLEAASQAMTEPGATVLLAFADERPPEVYRGLVDAPRAAHAIGVRMQAGAEGVDMAWEPSEREEAEEAGPEGFLSCLRGGSPATWHGGGAAWRWSRHAA
jgi:hypothetical protein